MRTAVIAGGGPAGASAAIALARARWAVTVIERTPAPSHQVCGEFLDGYAIAELRRLGVDVERLGAHPIRRARLLRGRARVDVALPFAGAGLSRRALDAALLEEAARRGAAIGRGQMVRRVDASGRVPGFVIAQDQLCTGDALFLASGKHDVRGAARHALRQPDDLIGFKTHLRLPPSQLRTLAATVELFLFDDAYIGLQPIEDGWANLCLVTTQGRLACADGGWQPLLATFTAESAALARRIENAAMWQRPLAVARIPYGFVHRPAPWDGPIFRLGDQVGVIPSFVGGGIAVALHTARLAVEAAEAGAPACAYHAAARRSLSRPIGIAHWVHQAGRVAPVQAIMMAAARLWPGCVTRLAGLTRVNRHGSPAAFSRSAVRLRNAPHLGGVWFAPDNGRNTP